MCLFRIRGHSTLLFHNKTMFSSPVGVNSCIHVLYNVPWSEIQLDSFSKSVRTK